MISYIDTAKVENIANDLSTLADELESEFDSLFKRLSGVPDITREWVGDQAKFYFNSTQNDKTHYTDFYRNSCLPGIVLFVEQTFI